MRQIGDVPHGTGLSDIFRGSNVQKQTRVIRIDAFYLINVVMRFSRILPRKWSDLHFYSLHDACIYCLNRWLCYWFDHHESLLRLFYSPLRAEKCRTLLVTSCLWLRKGFHRVIPSRILTELLKFNCDDAKYHNIQLHLKNSFNINYFLLRLFSYYMWKEYYFIASKA